MATAEDVFRKRAEESRNAHDWAKKQALKSDQQARTCLADALEAEASGNLELAEVLLDIAYINEQSRNDYREQAQTAWVRYWANNQAAWWTAALSYEASGDFARMFEALSNAAWADTMVARGN